MIQFSLDADEGTGKNEGEWLTIRFSTTDKDTYKGAKTLLDMLVDSVMWRNRVEEVRRQVEEEPRVLNSAWRF